MENSHKVRLRFVREDDGTVVIQINDAGEALPVGFCHFQLGQQVPLGTIPDPAQ